MDKLPVMTELKTGIAELHAKVDGHGRLLAKLMHLQERLENDNNNQMNNGSRARREKQLVNAIHEAIVVLEASRKSFHSKQLEGLRKKLMQVLLDIR